MEYRRTFRDSAWLLLITLAFVVLGVAIASTGKTADMVQGIFCGVFFMLMAWIALRRIFQPYPHVRIDEHGVFDRRMGTPTILWNEIRTVKVYKTFVGIWLIDDGDRLAQLSPMKKLITVFNRAIGYPPFLIITGGLNASSQDVFDAMTPFLEKEQGELY